MTTNLALSNQPMPEEQTDPSSFATTTPTVGSTIWRRYATAPGVIPLAVTRALTKRIVGQADSRLPLLNDLLQRWAAPGAAAEPAWPDLPFVTSWSWGKPTVLPGVVIASESTAQQPGRATGVQAPLALPVNGAPTHGAGDGIVNLQADQASPPRSVPAAEEQPAILVAPQIHAPLDTNDLASLPLALSVSAAPLPGIAPLPGVAPWRGDAPAGLAEPIVAAPGSVASPTMPLAFPLGAQPVTQRASDDVANSLIAQTQTEVAPSIALPSIQRSLASSMDSGAPRRVRRVGPPIAAETLSPVMVSPLPARAAPGEARAEGWAQSAPIAHRAAEASPVAHPPRTVDPPHTLPLAQPLLQAQVADTAATDSPAVTPAAVTSAGAVTPAGTVTPAATEPLALSELALPAGSTQRGTLAPVVLARQSAQADGGSESPTPLLTRPLPQQTYTGAPPALRSNTPTAVNQDQPASTTGLQRSPEPAPTTERPSAVDVSTPELVWQSTTQQSRLGQERGSSLALPTLAPQPAAALTVPAHMAALPAQQPSSVVQAQRTAIPAEQGEPATALPASRDWSALPLAVPQPWPTAQRSKLDGRTDLPLATAAIANNRRMVQTAPAEASTSPGQITSGAAASTVVTAPAVQPAAVANTANQAASLTELTERMTRRLFRELAVEQERQGWQRWNRQS